MLEARRTQDDPGEVRENIETLWGRLRRSMLGRVNRLEEVCEAAAASPSEEAAAPIVMASAAIAEATRALIAAVDTDDHALLGSALEDVELSHIVLELKAIEALASEQTAWSDRS